MLEHARERRAGIDRIAFVNDSYANFAQHISGVDFILLDIGVNREHFENTDSDDFLFMTMGRLIVNILFDAGENRSECIADVFCGLTYNYICGVCRLYSRKISWTCSWYCEIKAQERFVTTQWLRHFFRQFGIGKGAVTVLFQGIEELK